MIQIIAGKKGSGKTKRLIDMTNNAVKTSSGNVVFLDKNDSYMYEVDRAVRFVNVEEYSVSSAEMFLGFLGGIVGILAASLKNINAPYRPEGTKMAALGFATACVLGTLIALVGFIALLGAR